MKWEIEKLLHVVKHRPGADCRGCGEKIPHLTTAVRVKHSRGVGFLCKSCICGCAEELEKSNDS